KSSSYNDPQNTDTVPLFDIFFTAVAKIFLPKFPLPNFSFQLSHFHFLISKLLISIFSFQLLISKFLIPNFSFPKFLLPNSHSKTPELQNSKTRIPKFYQNLLKTNYKRMK
ncbi:MAG: hypothetical protein LBC49_04200, partial [Bacteroidales bacterium]|nr:hypothetical protein [Bacteroidales bacterium]